MAVTPRVQLSLQCRLNRHDLCRDADCRCAHHRQRSSIPDGHWKGFKSRQNHHVTNGVSAADHRQHSHDAVFDEYDRRVCPDCRVNACKALRVLQGGSP